MSETATVETKPVYSTGSSLGDILKTNEAVAAQPAQPAPAEPAATPAPVAEAVIQPLAEAPAPAEANVSTFVLPEYGEEAAEAAPANQPTAPAVNWQDAIKEVDQTEVLKVAGVSDFAIELDKHIKGGGDPLDYLNAKAIDYNKVSDESLVKADLQKQYPTFSPQQIDLMFNRKYGVSEDAEQEDKEFAELQLKADAHNTRQQKIAEQQRFKIAEPVQQNQEAQVQQAAEQRRQMEETFKWYQENEATKNLMTSKRVAIDLGEDGNFNYAIDKPEALMKGILDGETWRRMTSVNPKESDVTKLIPDVAKLQRLVLAASNPNYEKDLVNYGKSLALPKLVAEGQNISQPAKVIPPQNPNLTEKEAWKNARTSTVGGR